MKIPFLVGRNAAWRHEEIKELDEDGNGKLTLTEVIRAVTFDGARVVKCWYRVGGVGIRSSEK